MSCEGKAVGGRGDTWRQSSIVDEEVHLALVPLDRVHRHVSYTRSCCGIDIWIASTRAYAN
jgi:hypothetical protein